MPPSTALSLTAWGTACFELSGYTYTKVVFLFFFRWESRSKPGSFLPAMPSCSCSFIAVRCPLDCADAAVSGPCCKLDHWNKSEFLCAYVYVYVCEQLFFFFFGKTWIISVIWFITWPTKRWISTAEEAANSGAEVGTSVWAGGGRRKLLSQLC